MTDIGRPLDDRKVDDARGPMKTYLTAWLLFRGLRWLCWIAAAAYYLEVWVHHSNHATQFGHLTNSTEFWMFFLPIAGIAMGCFELMMRERTGRPRPAAFRDWSVASQ